jgi:hypothetical protein
MGNVTLSGNLMVIDVPDHIKNSEDDIPSKSTRPTYWRDWEAMKNKKCFRTDSSSGGFLRSFSLRPFLPPSMKAWTTCRLSRFFTENAFSD